MSERIIAPDCLIRTTPGHVRITCHEVIMRFLSQNLFKISLLRKTNSRPTWGGGGPYIVPTRFCRPMKSETHIFYFGLNTFPIDRVLSPIDHYFDRFELTQLVTEIPLFVRPV